MAMDVGNAVFHSKEKNEVVAGYWTYREAVEAKERFKKAGYREVTVERKRLYLVRGKRTSK
jgi:hypothetical protein